MNSSTIQQALISQRIRHTCGSSTNNIEATHAHARLVNQQQALAYRPRFNRLVSSRATTHQVADSVFVPVRHGARFRLHDGNVLRRKRAVVAMRVVRHTLRANRRWLQAKSGLHVHATCNMPHKAQLWRVHLVYVVDPSPTS